ncbi:ATP-binding protein [Sphingomonas sp. 4RDLI-65]|uniref:hybrid sensor histidine kinase/response regulator n=1 Tax=Sphingomonas sp. 4RDLI-65 TaxID=3111641 RepID=UPI003C1A8D60
MLTDAPFLIVAPAGRDATVIAQLLGSASLAHDADIDGDRLITAIAEGDAAGAIITDEVLASLNADRLRDALERQPPWSDFPIILLVRRGETRQGSRGYDDLLNVTILERPLHPASLISAARAALRARLRQRLAAQHLADRERAQAELRDLADTLEARVEQRTHDLAERTAERDRTWNNAQDLLVVIDRDGCFEAVNPAWTRLLGWELSEAIGRSHLHFNHPDDRAATEAALAIAWREPVFGYTNRLAIKGGGYRTISWVANSAGDNVYASGRDVTAEREVSEALLAAELRIKAVFDTTMLFQGFMDADGILLDSNATSLAAIELPLADVVGRPFWDTPWFTGTPGMPDRIRDAVHLTRAGTLFEREVVLHLPTGVRSFDLSMRPVVDASGKVIGIVPEGAETTQRRQAEESLRQAQKMEAVGQLTGGIAHDFNNLLAGMMGNLELLQLRIGQGRLDSVDRFVTAAQAAGQRAAALTQRLLAFSRRQTLDPKPTDINQLVAGMEDLLRRSVGPAVSIEIAPTRDASTSLIDSGQLENALLNLCINGRDAMPEGGVLTIETAAARIDGDGARRHDMAPGDYVVLAVTDTGTGMPPEVIARAFDPFYTTKPLGQGTGLGLSMIYGFARQSGGQVRVRSKVGTGSTISIYLPRHHGAATEKAVPTDAVGLQGNGTGRTVLVVDDEPAIRELIDEVLDELGYTVLSAIDGASGLKVLEAGTHVDLLVTDVGLPGGMNGRQVADAARVLRPGLKVLFITGYVENAAVGNGQLEPGMEVLTKPFSLDTLTTRIRDLTGGVAPHALA